jgi:hypothetical protein
MGSPAVSEAPALVPQTLKIRPAMGTNRLLSKGPAPGTVRGLTGRRLWPPHTGRPLWWPGLPHDVCHAQSDHTTGEHITHVMFLAADQRPVRCGRGGCQWNRQPRQLLRHTENKGTVRRGVARRERRCVRSDSALTGALRSTPVDQGLDLVAVGCTLPTRELGRARALDVDALSAALTRAAPHATMLRQLDA